jgi:hypothetical protein
MYAKKVRDLLEEFQKHPCNIEIHSESTDVSFSATMFTSLQRNPNGTDRLSVQKSLEK